MFIINILYQLRPEPMHPPPRTLPAIEGFDYPERQGSELCGTFEFTLPELCPWHEDLITPVHTPNTVDLHTPSLPNAGRACGCNLRPVKIDCSNVIRAIARGACAWFLPQFCSGAVVAQDERYASRRGRLPNPADVIYDTDTAYELCRYHACTIQVENS
jgi:hypothetical protein